MKKAMKSFEVSGNNQINMEMYNKAIIQNAKKVGNKLYAEVPLSEMRVELGYQRPCGKEIKKLVENWDIDKCDALIVSYRDGLFWIIDGQHRAVAARIKGVEFLTCDIRQNLTPHEEASIFVHQKDNVKRLTPCDIYRADVYNGEKYALDIKELCEKYHVQVIKDRGQSAAGEIGSISMAKKIYDAGGISALEWVLSVLMDAGYSNYTNGLSKQMMNLVYKQRLRFMSNLNAGKEKLSKFMGQYSPRMLISLAMSEYKGQATDAALDMYLKEYVK